MTRPPPNTSLRGNVAVLILGRVRVLALKIILGVWGSIRRNNGG